MVRGGDQPPPAAPEGALSGGQTGRIRRAAGNGRPRTGAAGRGRANPNGQPRRWRLSGGLGADDADEADALAGRAAQVVGEPQLLPVGNLAPARLASQLQPAFEEHAQPTGADGMAEALQATV